VCCFFVSVLLFKLTVESGFNVLSLLLSLILLNQSRHSLHRIGPLLPTVTSNKHQGFNFYQHFLSFFTIITMSVSSSPYLPAEGGPVTTSYEAILQPLTSTMVSSTGAFDDSALFVPTLHLAVSPPAQPHCPTRFMSLNIACFVFL
jgi:hypothetical protein